MSAAPAIETYLDYGTRHDVYERRGRYALELCSYAGGSYWVIAEKVGCDGSKSSRHAGKDEAAARAAWTELLARKPCRECGEPPQDYAPSFNRNGRPPLTPEQSRFFIHDGEAAVEADLCFGCGFWTNLLAGRDEKTVIVGGRFYTIGEDVKAIARRTGFPMDGKNLRSDYQHVLGHGGARFDIEFLDGRSATTFNLWSSGTIPPHFRDRLPDNARWRARAESSAYVGAGSATESELPR